MCTTLGQSMRNEHIWLCARSRVWTCVQSFCSRQVSGGDLFKCSGVSVVLWTNWHACVTQLTTAYLCVMHRREIMASTLVCLLLSRACLHQWIFAGDACPLVYVGRGRACSRRGSWHGLWSCCGVLLREKLWGWWKRWGGRIFGGTDICTERSCHVILSGLVTWSCVRRVSVHLFSPRAGLYARISLLLWVSFTEQDLRYWFWAPLRDLSHPVIRALVVSTGNPHSKWRPLPILAQLSESESWQDLFLALRNCTICSEHIPCYWRSLLRSRIWFGKTPINEWSLRQEIDLFSLRLILLCAESATDAEPETAVTSGFDSKFKAYFFGFHDHKALSYRVGLRSW